MNIIHKTIFTITLLASCMSSFAQDTTRVVEITVNKATSITFPANVLDGIKVSRDVLSQRPKGIDNVLLLTAKRPKFRETNLTVFTGNRRLYQFIIRYSDQPSEFNVEVKESGQPSASSLQLSSELTKTDLQEYSERIVSSPLKFPKRSTSKFGMTLTLRGIYIEHNVMFYHLRSAIQPIFLTTRKCFVFLLKTKNKASVQPHRKCNKSQSISTVMRV